MIKWVQGLPAVNVIWVWAGIILLGAITMPLFKSSVEELIYNSRVNLGHTIENCFSDGGEIQLVGSSALFGGRTEKVCLLPNGDTYETAEPYAPSE